MTTNKLSERYCKSVVDRVMKNAATKHKGDFGRVGILGGSKDYAGAPYFAAAAALRSVGTCKGFHFRIECEKRD